jgi:hypothetical protein
MYEIAGEQATKSICQSMRSEERCKKINKKTFRRVSLTFADRSDLVGFFIRDFDREFLCNIRSRLVG